MVSIKTLEKNCEEHGIDFWGLGHKMNGIVHVIGPENGITQPGLTIVCGDSHTSTHGAFGAIASCPKQSMNASAGLRKFR